ncbi:MAG: virulence RhuM family protein [Tannerellaceae bacterium]|jgi:hypothetical protein|nr:virulence RhuM family protein [Tannerellaceae bacterium]
MENRIIRIENGVVSVPDRVEMSIAEIADMFGIYYRTAKQHIRSIEKSGVVDGDYTTSCSVEGLTIHPDYYELEMIIAVAFRVQSAKAEIFRRHIMRKVVRHDVVATLILPLQNSMFN